VDCIVLLKSYVNELNPKCFKSNVKDLDSVKFM